MSYDRKKVKGGWKGRKTHRSSSLRPAAGMSKSARSALVRKARKGGK